jgi:hypothetical protein
LNKKEANWKNICSKSLINIVFLSFDNEKLSCVIIDLRKDIKKPLDQAKDPEVKERTYDAYYIICAST